MSIEDAAKLVHFRELHLLPRTIFSIGAICFVGAFFIKTFIIGFLGVGLIFVALSLNFLIGVLMGTDISLRARTFTVPWMLLFQFVISSAVAYKLLILIYFYYRHGEMPPYLRPDPHLATPPS